MTGLWQSISSAAPELIRTMARHEVQTALFIVFLLVVDSWFQRSSPRFRYVLWLVALAKALWPPFLSLSALDIWGRQTVVAETLAPIFAAPITLMIPVEPAGFTLTWGALALAAWTALSLVVVSLMVVNFVRFRLRLRPPHAEPYSYDEPQSATGRPWPPIWATGRIHSPLTVGLLRPRIYLTWKIIASGPRALRAILYHELAHILRRDGWITILQAAALAIHPFNPLVWLMNARLSRYREQLCDDFALKHTGVAPRDYGNMLLDQLSQGKLPLLAAQTPTYFFETKRDLVQRLHQLLKQKGRDMNLITSPQKMLLAGLACGLLLIASQCQQEIEPFSPTLNQIDGTDQAIPGYPVRVIDYSLAESGPVRVVAYTRTPTGDEDVALLFSGPREAGPMQVTWGGRNEDGEPVPPGVYFIRIEAPGESRTFRTTFRNVETSATKTDNVTPTPRDYGVVDISYDEPPQPIGGYAAIQENLVYPNEARAAGIEGRVAVQVFITEDGKAEEMLVLANTSGDASLAEAAMAAIQNTPFKPSQQEDGPVGVWISIPVNFTLDDPSTTEPSGGTSEAAMGAQQNPSSPPISFTPPRPVGGMEGIYSNLVYPPEAKAAGLSGVVFLEVFVDQNGKVTVTRVRQSPDPSLTEAASEAVRKTRWTPAKGNGTPMDMRTGIYIHFDLSDTL